MRAKSKFKALLLGLAVLPWILPAAPAGAAECDAGVSADASYFAMLDALMRRPCFGDQANASRLGKRVNEILAAEDNSSATDRTDRALAEIGAYLTENYDRQNGIQVEITDLVSKALLSLQESVRARPEDPETALKANWQFRQLGRPPRALRGLDLARLLPEDRCAPVSAGACEAELAFAVQLLQAVQLINLSIDTYTEKFRGDVLADRTLRRSKWDSYYDDLTFQYPWELWANSLLLQWTDDRKSMDGNLLGFRKLPGSKLVLLHPEVNLLYAQDAESEYDTALTFEVLGFENFDFGSKGKVDSSYGMSLLAAYVDGPDGRDAGWTGGLMFKLNGYSLGITDNHGEQAIIFNINLSQRLFDVKQEARRYYDEYEEKVKAFEQQLEQ